MTRPSESLWKFDCLATSESNEVNVHLNYIFRKKQIGAKSDICTFNIWKWAATINTNSTRPSWQLAIHLAHLSTSKNSMSNRALINPSTHLGRRVRPLTIFGLLSSTPLLMLSFQLRFLASTGSEWEIIFAFFSILSLLGFPIRRLGLEARATESSSSSSDSETNSFFIGDDDSNTDDDDDDDEVGGTVEDLFGLG